ncbi:hypothetical protein PTSG_02787 [Salpingoeca rosetta]|uniref:PH domain-containing protein n=1 Tax=Salpingoeca rosetta (strain ATCC 50818 / BSB-021) TaxID=946362 RepID=F2U3B4_SALR5|nr:uncharacterized protein PTSG_02787 [Salpingoeca rosetta]EGD82108.1 hypothetical protein PTSG_02787 [Salpingoeca rosetta]|eukprot:XP_004996291.1 hypothetical protein PTSG_02787 [Salpingoeca rosetta]
MTSRVGSKLKFAGKAKEAAPEVVRSGYVTKMGQVVKNWKMRWLELYSNGMLVYYKKEPRKDDKPQGEVNIASDCLDILTHAQATAKQMCKWPEDVADGSGFALVTRSGRTYFMYCDSVEEAERWITMCANVAANARYEDGGDSIREIRSRRGSVRRPETSKQQTELVPDLPNDEGKDVCYVHKVVGGVVIKEKHTVQ